MRCVAVGVLLLSACRSGAARFAPTPVVAAALAAAADEVHSERVADGVVLHQLVRKAASPPGASATAGPLRFHVLDIDLTACVSLRALKGSPTAVGRTTTSALLGQVPASDAPIAAVNADFFLFTPPGVPVGAMVQDGRVVSGPVARPVLAFDGGGRPFIGPLQVEGALVSTRARLPLGSWNRPSPNAIGIVDASWGQPLDSLARPGALMLVPLEGVGASRRYLAVDIAATHDGVARGDTVMAVGIARASILAGDTVRIESTLSPFMPRTAVGAFPLLVRDSAIVPTVDRDGADSFRGVNPRTAVGIASNGQRLLLVVIDGRQKDYSVGTTSRETAAIMLALGAREAVNLDGGGSSAMVVRDAASQRFRVVNKPSDATGERPVGNALGVFGRCTGR